VGAEHLGEPVLDRLLARDDGLLDLGAGGGLAGRQLGQDRLAGLGQPVVDDLLRGLYPHHQQPQPLLGGLHLALVRLRILAQVEGAEVVLAVALQLAVGTEDAGKRSIEGQDGL
jgi:hypothetical protein